MSSHVWATTPEPRPVSPPTGLGASSQRPPRAACVFLGSRKAELTLLIRTTLDPAGGSVDWSVVRCTDRLQVRAPVRRVPRLQLRSWLGSTGRNGPLFPSHIGVSLRKHSWFVRGFVLLLELFIPILISLVGELLVGEKLCFCCLSGPSGTPASGGPSSLDAAWTCPCTIVWSSAAQKSV